MKTANLIINWLLSDATCHRRHRAVGSSFMVGAGRWGWGWVMVSRQLKIKRKHWLKHPKAVPQKTKFVPKYRCYWKYYFWHTTFTLIHMFQRTSSKFFVLISDFLEESLKTKKKLLIKITYFTIQVCSKHLTHFTNLNSLDIENNILPKHCQKYFWLYKFLKKHVSVWCQKKHLDCTISWNPITEFLKHFQSKCLFISVYLRFLFQRVVKFYLIGWVMVGGGMISSGVLFLPVWTPCTYILTFHFNWNFLEIQLSFSISILPSIALKRWNFPDSLDFNSKIMANFS